MTLHFAQLATKPVAISASKAFPFKLDPCNRPIDKKEQRNRKLLASKAYKTHGQLRDPYAIKLVTTTTTTTTSSSSTTVVEFLNYRFFTRYE